MLSLSLFDDADAKSGTRCTGTMRHQKTKQEEEEDALEQTFLLEVQRLRQELAHVYEENQLLSSKVEELTQNLTVTTHKLESRMKLLTESMAQVQTLENNLSDAKKAILSREMKLHDTQQANNRLHKQLETLEKEKQHWEHEFMQTQSQFDALKHQYTQHKNDAHEEMTVWQKKAADAVRAMEELQRVCDQQQTRESDMMATMDEMKAAWLECEQRLKIHLVRRQKKLEKADRELTTLRSTMASMEAAISTKQAEATSQHDLQVAQWQQVVDLRAKVAELTTTIDSFKAKECIMRKELTRLREQVIASEEQLKCSDRRHAQAMRGKEKEMAFIWQKYLEVMMAQRAA